MIIWAGYVPDDFGQGITVRIPKNGYKAISNSNDFRGITINPVISKVFESFMLDKLMPFLITSNRQYGFKKGSGCSQAIHDLKQTVDYYTSRDSTINIATLDISKAFDKINHYKLLLQLMKRFIRV